MGAERGSGPARERRYGWGARAGALAFGLVVSAALVAGWCRFGRPRTRPSPPGALRRQANGRLLLRVSHEQEIWRAGALFLFDPAPERSPLRPEVDVRFAPLRHGLANLERVKSIPPPEHRVFTNSRGFRTAEFGWAKPAGVFRIVVLGDSVAYGLAVDPDRTFAAGLERELGAAAGPGRAVEVLDLGVPGLTLARVLSLYEGMPALEADVVLFGAGYNDYGYCQNAGKDVLKRIRIPGHRWRLRAVADGPASSWSPLPMPERAAILRTAVRYGPEACPPQTAPAEFARTIDRFVEVARARGQTPVLLDLELARRVYRPAATRAAAALEVPVYHASDDLLDAELRRGEPKKSGARFAPMLPPAGARHVRLRIRLRPPPGERPTGGYRVVAKPLGRDVYKSLPQAPWAPRAFPLGGPDPGGLFQTTLWVPVGETIKFFFLPGRAERWSLADLPVAQTFAELAGRTRVFFTYPPDLARYHRAGDPADLYVTPRYTYGAWDLMHEAVHPNAAGHRVIAAGLARRVRRLPVFRR